MYKVDQKIATNTFKKKWVCCVSERRKNFQKQTEKQRLLSTQRKIMLNTNVNNNYNGINLIKQVLEVSMCSIYYDLQKRRILYRKFYTKRDCLEFRFLLSIDRCGNVQSYRHYQTLKLNNFNLK